MIGMLAGAAGGAVAIGIMEAFSTRAAIPLMAIPFVSMSCLSSFANTSPTSHIHECYLDKLFIALVTVDAREFDASAAFTAQDGRNTGV